MGVKYLYLSMNKFAIKCAFMFFFFNIYPLVICINSIHGNREIFKFIVSSILIQGVWQHSVETWKIRKKSGKLKKSGKTGKPRGISWKMKALGKFREVFYTSFQLVDPITMVHNLVIFGHICI